MPQHRLNDADRVKAAAVNRAIRAARVEVMEHRETPVQLNPLTERRLRDVAIEIGLDPSALLEQLVRSFFTRRYGRSDVEVVR